MYEAKLSLKNISVYFRCYLFIKLIKKRVKRESIGVDKFIGLFIE